MPGVAPRRCLGLPGAPCSARIRKGSRCAACASVHERQREAGRADRRRRHEPWRALYGTPQWRKARARRLVLDEGRCVDCGTSHSVSVDHCTPLRVLWQQHTSFASFVERATRLEDLRTRCPSCHAIADADRRTG